jgi:signal peptidase I
MSSRRLVALALAFFAPWGVGHFHFGRRLRACVWLAVPMIALAWLGATLARVGHGLGWTFACLLPLAVLVIAWLASLVDLVFTREGPAVPWWQTLVFGIVGLASPIVVAIGLRGFALESFRVPSESMEPTIFPSDRLFADKTDRRARYGDLVIFPNPDGPNQTFIKRVIARPGDTLEMKSGRPWINGWQVPSCSLGEVTLDTKDGELVVEFLGDAAYLVFYDAAVPSTHAGPLYANASSVLVLGDNRSSSFDSRAFHGGLDGNVPLATIRGRATFVWMRASEDDDKRFGIDLGIDAPIRLPSSLASSRSALDKCLASRPLANPPPPTR